jgi:hypothetical protein
MLKTSPAVWLAKSLNATVNSHPQTLKGRERMPYKRSPDVQHIDSSMSMVCYGSPLYVDLGVAVGRSGSNKATFQLRRAVDEARMSSSSITVEVLVVISVVKVAVSVASTMAYIGCFAAQEDIADLESSDDAARTATRSSSTACCQLSYRFSRSHVS